MMASVVATLDIIGYYGNSGNAVSYIPKLGDVHPNYNVLILTFASIDSTGAVSLDIQGPYENDMPGLAAAVHDWRTIPDPFGRKRSCLISIGGQNGQWPSGLSADVVLQGLTSFMSELGLDGLDIDLEGQAVSAATSLVPVIKALTSQGKLVTAAPEAAQYSLTAYADMLQYLSWVHPQFYNNGPNAITTPFLPPADLWPTPWTVTSWQDEKNNTAFWGGVVAAIASAEELSLAQQGMLIPATPAAASQYNNWDIAKLATEVGWSGIQHVGTWAVAYDNKNSWLFAKTMGQLNLNATA
jgi:chitinase